MVLGAAATIASVVLLVWDAGPEMFPPRAHDYLGAFALGAIAVAWFLWQKARGMSAAECVRTAILATAFLFWAANQLWPNFRGAILFNDLAVGLFVLDVLLAILQWPSSPPTENRHPDL